MQEINWSELSFGYMPTDVNVRCEFKDGKWGDVYTCEDPYINVHMAATGLHYGQEAFEGMKAFQGKDGKVRVFRMDENFKRLKNSCEGILMADLPWDKFENAIMTVIKENKRFIPPYGHGASLYIRPLIFGSGAQVGVKPSSEYMFVVFVTPVGPYFKEGFKPTSLMITREFDRAAPQGTGTLKVGGNYAASLRSGQLAKENGYSAVLFLDAKEKKYIDECGPANFFGIKNNTYITPKSPSILPSITNMSLQVLAKELGMEVEVRPIPVEELDTFEEVGACGTAAVISPVGSIMDYENKKEYKYGTEAGEKSTLLYEKLKRIQNGEEEDKWDWTFLVE
ncbi:branched chain amino acid aminotransferase [Balneicella halophila]|uniref:branched-chain-amino-acid transaminase n=1 Tax=Balneicella halophila TaxID=1537566 RepID=A0A7L4URE6_BALHA|nr:branched-chain amino acid aminotransferase [Balneicella halophila]PVX52323.1 branched chain amino acid aminotransferase [Balneicella halophila]